MPPISILVGLWANVQWIFTAWLPSWWRAMESDVNYIRNIGG